jgi:NAD dependent epimerase/dehydratase
MMSQTLEGRRVLVTGSDGFIGSHLVERLLELGAEVRAFVFYNSWNSIGWLNDTPERVRSSIEIFPGDVRDAERVRQASSGCDLVFHLSSLIAIPYSYHAPRSYVETNVIGALNVLEACKASDRITRIIHTSTSEVYGTAQKVPIDEDHPLVGQSPYSASKIAADQIALSFHRSFELPVVVARPFNTFGPRQTARAVIPTIASQLLSGAETLKLGALSPTRDFTFVSDTVEALIALADCDKAMGQVLNIGTGEERSIEETARLLMKICGRDIPIISEEERTRPEKSEVNRLLADTTRLQEATGWSPLTHFEKGLRRTVDWISENLDYFDPNRYVI